MSYHVLRACVYMTACVLVIIAAASQSNPPDNVVERFLTFVGHRLTHIMETDPTSNNATRPALTVNEYKDFELRLKTLMGQLQETSEKFTLVKSDPEVRLAIALLTLVQDRNEEYGRDFWAKNTRPQSPFEFEQPIGEDAV